MNDAKISVQRTWQTSKRIGEEREKRGGLRRDERLSLPFPFFSGGGGAATQAMVLRPVNKRKKRTRNGWTGKHRRCFKIIPYHISPQG